MRALPISQNEWLMKAVATAVEAAAAAVSSGDGQVGTDPGFQLGWGKWFSLSYKPVLYT